MQCSEKTDRPKQFKANNPAMWGLILLEQLARDVRHGLRQVRRSPVFSAVAIATLALGIGVNTAMFSAVDAVPMQS
jgi:hypothetical protein